MHHLKNTLDKFYRDYDFKGRIRHDPIEFPHRYTDAGDIEVAGFIASCFAYGRVDLFKPVIEKILAPGGRHPAKFLKDLSIKKDGKYFVDISYRFNKGKDVLCIIYMINRGLNEWGLLRDMFYHYYSADHDDIKTALDGFVGRFLDIDTTPVYGRNIKPYGLQQLLPSPRKGSACKRLNLFLRWMVRTKDIDLGIWDRIPPSKLIIPLDTHIARISRCLGLTKRTASDWKTAKEITEELKKFDHRDPLKYDFALCHHGISGLCKGRKSRDICATCGLSAA
ncbi:MAG: TIGR02757 family protein [Nitrospirota bacterium]